MRLRYKAVSQEGKKVRGFVEAKEIKDAAYYLRQRNLIPIQIAKESEPILFKKMPGIGGVKSKDIILFTRQLSSMLTSGLTLIKSLEILKEQTNNKFLQETIGGILLDLQEGRSFSDSISKYPDIFSPVYISLVKAGESSGLLDKVFL
ncbi:type II secretion system F family protein, partial [Candidatus Curtissbacteria bacterium]|nr:type II secretion system F family protein [Candidatus Curtissbacteria bacterium]